MKMAPIVDAVVMRTDRATSPWAIYVATFDACPPGQHETRISPVDKAGDKLRTCIPGPQSMQARRSVQEPEAARQLPSENCIM